MKLSGCESDVVEYKFWFKVENLKLMPGTYDVEVSQKRLVILLTLTWCAVLYCPGTRIFVWLIEEYIMENFCGSKNIGHGYRVDAYYLRL